MLKRYVNNFPAIQLFQSFVSLILTVFLSKQIYRSRYILSINYDSRSKLLLEDNVSFVLLEMKRV